MLLVESIDADNTNDGGVFVSEGCRSVDCYQRLDSIQEGSYGVVYRAKDVQTGEIFALKKIKMQKESEGERKNGCANIFFQKKFQVFQ